MARTIILDGKRVSFVGKRNEDALKQPDIFTVVKKSDGYKSSPTEKKTPVKVDNENTDDSLSFDNIEIKGEIE